MSDTKIKNLMDTTLEKLKVMVNADVITGTPIVVGNVTLIPVSKVAYGLATGGSGFASSKSQNELFGGGGGAGVTISPIALKCSPLLTNLQILTEHFQWLRNLLKR